MSIIAIDPGPVQSAYVAIVPSSKFIGSFGKIKNVEMLDVLGCYSTEKSVETKLIVEMVASYGMPVGESVFETARWTGIFQQKFGLKNTELLYRKEVKMNLCGSMRANDSNIRQAIIDRYGGEDKAIGGKKCSKCKGKGWFGAGRNECPECHGRKWETPPGELHGVHSDIWAAIGVALTWIDKQG